MLNINYTKRKNHKFFSNLQKNPKLNVEKVQNYQPIYKLFFEMNSSNFDSINLNNKWFVDEIYDDFEDEDNDDDSSSYCESKCSDGSSELLNFFDCQVKNDKNKKKVKEIFFKIAPLIDPIKYLIGKFKSHENHCYKLPLLMEDVSNNEVRQKINSPNNSAYIDGFFSYLTGVLADDYNMINSVHFYGSFPAIKNNFKFNIIDDLELLEDSTYFRKNCNDNGLFKVEDFNDIFEIKKLEPIQIHNEDVTIETIELNSLTNNYENEIKNDNNHDINKSVTDDNNNNNIDLAQLKDLNIDGKFNERKSKSSFSSSSSSSSISSKSSHTTDSSNESDNDIDKDYESSLTSQTNTDEYSDFSDDDEIIATIHKFPVHIISMDSCDDTFDNLIMSNKMTPDEWYSALFQVIMILIIYQKAFSFTHNDLHTNNIMFSETDQKFLFYVFDNKSYKVPTFGRIFKIIDFGRSIYNVNNIRFCSNSFEKGGDADTQYNTEPFFNSNKPRIDPNMSFDLCRLGCSIFDYLVNDISDVHKYINSTDISNLDTVRRLIIEWCVDDNGVNILYKKDGSERYPEFKLYKMIARCVHNHTPVAQLERDIFKQFETTAQIKKNKIVTNIDAIPCFI